jgi:hypothetical protein
VDWVEEEEDLPVPPFPLHDPVVGHLFNAWYAPYNVHSCIHMMKVKIEFYSINGHVM